MPRVRLLVAIIVALALLWLGGRAVRALMLSYRPTIVRPSDDARSVMYPSFAMRVAALEQRFFPPRRLHREKLIALTFDDGPYPVTTPLLLDELQRLHVRATFFLIGRDARQWPQITARILRDGNEIANHTYSHPNLDALDAAQIRAELTRGRHALEKLAPDPSEGSLMRPPHGRYSLATLQQAQALGYTVVLWTDDAGDWRTLTSSAIQAHLLSNATAPEIVLLHSGKITTVEALPKVVARFRQAGYRFVTVGELLRKVPLAQLLDPARHPV